DDMAGGALLQVLKIVLVLRERLLQALEGIPHAALYRVLGRADDDGDLFEREILDLAHQKNLPLLIGELLDRASDGLLELAADGLAIRGMGLRRDAIEERRAMLVVTRTRG